MYLDLQAKDYDEKMEQTLEKCCNKAVDDVIEGLKQQIEDLKKEIESLKSEDDQMENTLASLNFYKECNEDLKKEINELKEENNDMMKKVIVHVLQEESLHEVCVDLKKRIEDIEGEESEEQD